MMSSRSRSNSDVKKVTEQAARQQLTMALVAGYDSDEDEDFSEPSFPVPSTSRAGPSKAVHAAPEVSLEVPFVSLFITNNSGSHAVKTDAR